MQKITTFLWYNDQAEEAINFYTSIFKDAQIGKVSRMGDGKMMTASFYLNGQEFIALNGGPMFKFTEAISLLINCEDQQEIDYYWEKLSDGGEKSRCGWLKDKFGLSWQVVPVQLGSMMSDPGKGGRVMQALMQMDKLDIAILQQAYENQ